MGIIRKIREANEVIKGSGPGRGQEAAGRAGEEAGPEEAGRQAMSTRLVRAGKGKDTIHRADCRYAKGGLPWEWAEQRSDAAVAAAAAANGLRLCKVCAPATQTAEFRAIADAAQALETSEAIAAIIEETADDLNPPVFSDWLEMRSWFKGQLHTLAAQAREAGGHR